MDSVDGSRFGLAEIRPIHVQISGNPRLSCMHIVPDGFFAAAVSVLESFLRRIRHFSPIDP